MSTASYFFLTTKQAWKQINSFLLSLRLFLILISAEICALPAEQGNCFGNKRRWYYDGASGQCSTFTYGGCKGNGNNFKTKEECEAECRSDIESKTKEAGKGLVLGELLCWTVYTFIYEPSMLFVQIDPITGMLDTLEYYIRVIAEDIIGNSYWLRK